MINVLNFSPPPSLCDTLPIYKMSKQYKTTAPSRFETGAFKRLSVTVTIGLKEQNKGKLFLADEYSSKLVVSRRVLEPTRRNTFLVR